MHCCLEDSLTCPLSIIICRETAKRFKTKKMKVFSYPIAGIVAALLLHVGHALDEEPEAQTLDHPFLRHRDEGEI